MINGSFIKYCKKCIIPEIRPHTEIGEDVILVILLVLYKVKNPTKFIDNIS